VHSRMDLDDPHTLEAGPTGGLLRDLGSHLVDQMLWLLGHATSVDAQLDFLDLPPGSTDASFTLTTAARERSPISPFRQQEQSISGVRYNEFYKNKLTVTNPPSQNQIRLPELWSPPQDISTTIIGRFMDFARRRSGQPFNNYQALHRWSVENLEEFWSAFWDFAQIIGDKAAQVMGTLPNVPWVQFFPDSKISYTENMLAHAADKPGEPAIIYRLQGEEDRVMNWQALYDNVSRWEQALAAEGLEEGDTISVYLPNIPETIIILLAASNLGIVFSSAGMEMGPADLINRFGQVQPQLLITTDRYVHSEKGVRRRFLLSNGFLLLV
jgi:hypothetical protein